MMALAALLIGAALLGAGVWAGHRFASFSWRPLYDSLKVDRDGWKEMALERQGTMDRMRQDGFMLQKAATVKEPLDVETEGLARAEGQLIQRRADAHFIDQAKKDIMRKNPGTSERAAHAEAVRLRNEVMMEDPPT